MTVDDDLVRQLLASPPRVHRGETEHYSGQSTRPAAKQACYGCDEDLLRFLTRTVRPEWRSLEVGCGLTTLVIAGCGAEHISVSPNKAEFDVLRAYALTFGVKLDRVTFVAEPSETYLPGCRITNLNLALIDGKHAFPWPVVDWFYLADRLAKGGYLVLDDTSMESVRVLTRFLDEDPRWRRVGFFGRAAVYVKLTDTVHHVAWHEQPFITNRYHTGSLVRRTIRRVYRTLFPKRG